MSSQKCIFFWYGFCNSKNHTNLIGMVLAASEGLWGFWESLGIFGNVGTSRAVALRIKSTRDVGIFEYLNTVYASPMWWDFVINYCATSEVPRGIHISDPKDGHRVTQKNQQIHVTSFTLSPTLPVLFPILTWYTLFLFTTPISPFT